MCLQEYVLFVHFFFPIACVHVRDITRRVAVFGNCAAVCCSVLQCVAVCCSVLQCVAVCCSVLQRQFPSETRRLCVCTKVVEVMSMCVFVYVCVYICVCVCIPLKKNVWKCIKKIDIMAFGGVGGGE